MGTVKARAGREGISFEIWDCSFLNIWDMKFNLHILSEMDISPGNSLRCEICIFFFFEIWDCEVLFFKIWDTDFRKFFHITKSSYLAARWRLVPHCRICSSQCGAERRYGSPVLLVALKITRKCFNKWYIKIFKSTIETSACTTLEFTLIFNPIITIR